MLTVDTATIFRRGLNFARCTVACSLLQSQDKKLPVDPEEATRRKLRVHTNFEELMDDYLSRRVPIIPGICSGVCVCVCVHSNLGCIQFD